MTQRRGPRPLHTGFLASVDRGPTRPAVEVAGETLSYGELLTRASGLAATLHERAADDDPKLTAVFAQRSPTAFAGVLASLLRGHGYVPLNPTFPPDRTRLMLQRSKCRCVIVDKTSAQQLASVLEGIDRPLILLLPDVAEVTELRTQFPQHVILGARDQLDGSQFQPVRSSPGDIAYLLFTSGSTGQPKGVMVAHRNVAHFIDVMIERYAITENDRLSQMFDMTFDLSVFDMFMAWEAGACLCCPSMSEKLLPAAYINDSNLTVWFSVPSTAVLLNRLRQLEPGAFPQLRLSLFCGEALPVEVVEAWSEAAPNSIIENLYGPTELTIACTLYRWDPTTSPHESHNGIVPIGYPYAGMEVLVADEARAEVPPGSEGELLMTGPQVTLGYWEDVEKTKAAFVVPAGRTETFYCTGDRVRRSIGTGPLLYLGRVDHQIKVRGYRIELGEIEATLRRVAGVDTAVAIGWPMSPNGVEGIVAFVGTQQVDIEQVKQDLQLELPEYMIPREIHLKAEFPLNPNGKVDRRGLQASLERVDE